jgi:hypothetical protein
MTNQPGRYRKLPVEIEAAQWDGTAEGATRIIDWILSHGSTATYTCSNPDRCAEHNGDTPHSISIRTLEGTMRADLSDWIVRSVQGEFDLCKPDIFAATYEPAAAPAVVEPPTTWPTEPVREQLLHCLDFSACQTHGYTTPEELLAAYDTSRTPTDQTALRDRIAAAVEQLHETGAVYALGAGEAGRIADAVLAVLPSAADWDALVREADNQLTAAEADLAAVETALGDTLVPAAREEALAGIAAVLPEPTDRAAVLRAEADRIDATRADFPIAVRNGITWATAEMRRHAAECPECGTTGACNGGPCPLRRMADETATAETHACPNCEGVDPDTCFNNPHRPPEQCPRSEGDGYGLQCQKPAGHNLCTFEEQPAVGARQDGATS